MKTRGLRKRARWLIAASLAGVVTAGMLSAPATAAVRPQMAASITFDPVVVRAPGAGVPDQIVTYQGSFSFDGYGSTPEAVKTTARFELPAGVAIQSVSPAQCKTRKNVVTCAFGTVPEYEQRTVTVRTKVTRAQVGDHLGATFTAWAQNVDRNPAGDTTQNNGPRVVANSADLSVAFSSWRDSVAPGAEMSYNITASNDGPLTTAPAVLIIKTGSQLPDPRVRVDSPNTCTRTADGFRCPFVRWIALEMTGTVDPASEGTVLSTTISAEFTGDDHPADPDPGNDTATKTTHVEQRADIGVGLSVSPGTVAAADLADEPALTYHATVTNHGPGVARDTTLGVAPGNSGIELVSAPDGCTSDGNVQCAVGDLAVGASREYVIKAKATPRIVGEQADVWAQVDAANNDFEKPDDNQRFASLSVPGNLADLGITMGADPRPVAGRPVTVVARVTNHGPLPRAGAEVQINLGTPLGDDVKVETDGGTCRVADTSNDYFECTLPDLSSDERVITITGSTGLAAGDDLSGYARVRPVDDRPKDPVSSNDYVSMSVPVGA